MDITISINGEVEHYDSLFIALKELEQFEDHRWGLPRSRDLESGAVPSSMTMPALYDGDGSLVTTNPQTALLKLVEAKVRNRLEGIEITVSEGDYPKFNKLEGFLKGRRVHWTTTAKQTMLLTPTEVLQWREANLQIAEHLASQARLQRDQDIESFVSTETLTAYRVAKTLKITAPAVAQIRKRLASTTQEN